MSKRRRKNNRHLALTVEQYTAIECWMDLIQTPTVEAACERAHRQWGISIPHEQMDSLLTDAGKRRNMRFMQHTAQKAVSECDKWRDSPFASATFEEFMARIRQLAFEQALNEGKEIDTKMLLGLARLVISGQSLKLEEQAQERKFALDERRVQLLEQKAEKASEEDGAASPGELSPEEEQARLKEIFGMV